MALASAAPVFAQDSTIQPDSESVNRIDEIIVTAQRREQSMQDVPISVSALDSEIIRDAGFSNSLSIGDHVPNLEIKTFAGVPNVFIRGVGNNDFNSSSVGPVSFYRDDVVVASTGSQIFSLFDLERIEVLRGPQGTLFGKNTTGGAIQYITKLPGQEFEGYAKVGYGRYNLFDAEAAATLPISENLSMRVSGLVRQRDGERTNAFTGDDTLNIDEAAVRGIVRYQPGDSLDIRLSSGVGRDRSDFLQPKPLGIINGGDLFGYTDPDPDDFRAQNFNGGNRSHTDNFWASLSISADLGNGFNFKSITGYDESDIDNRFDVDGSPNRLNQIDFFTETDQITQEFQLNYSNDRTSGLVGLFLFDESLEARSEADALGGIPAFALPVITDAARDNTSYAIFGQVTHDLTDRLSLTGGLRYTWDEIEAEHRGYLIPGFFDDDIENGAEIDLLPFAELGDTFKALSWRVALDYDITDDIMTYASVNRGFKSGAFNLGIQTSLAERTKVEPEFLTAYEVGIKSTLFDSRVRLNASAFYYDYTDLQVLSVNLQEGSAVPTLGLDNAADAKITGLEVELFARPTNTLDLGLNFGLLNAEYKNYTSGAIDPASGLPRDFSGNSLPGAPKFTLSTFAQQTVPLGERFEALLRAELNHTAKQFFSNAEDDQVSSGESRNLVNLRATLRPNDADWQLSAWGRNIFDTEYLVDATDLRNFGYIPLYYGEGATWGVEATFDF